MAEPKQKMSRSRTRKRRATQKILALTLVKCPKCKEKILPHHVCPFCGTYKGKEIFDVKTKVLTRIKNKKSESRNSKS